MFPSWQVGITAGREKPRNNIFNKKCKHKAWTESSIRLYPFKTQPNDMLHLARLHNLLKECYLVETT